MASDAGERLSIDLGEIREEIGDARLLRAVLKAYCAYLVDQTRRLERAFHRGEHSEVRRIAHAIRGGAAILRASALGELASTVERSASVGSISPLDPGIPALVAAARRACHDLALLARRPPE